MTDLQTYPTSTLEAIEEDLERTIEKEDGLLGYYGKKWANERLHEVSRLVNDRAWTTTQWKKGND